MKKFLYVFFGVSFLITLAVTESPQKRPNNTSITEPLTIQKINRAARFCTALDTAGVLSEPCELDKWNNKIIISLNTNAYRALETCLDLRLEITGMKGWSLVVKSPFSHGNSIAYCELV